MACGGCSKGSAPLRVLKYNSGTVPKPVRPKNAPVPVRRKMFTTSVATKSAFSADNRV